MSALKQVQDDVEDGARPIALCFLFFFKKILLARVELGAGLGVVLEELRRGKVGAVLVGKPLHQPHHLGGAIRVDVAERASQERREAEAKDRADVAVDRVRQNPLLIAMLRACVWVRVRGCTDRQISRTFQAQTFQAQTGRRGDGPGGSRWPR